MLENPPYSASVGDIQEIQNKNNFWKDSFVAKVLHNVFH